MKLKRLVLPFSLLVLNANAAVSADLKLPEPKAPFLKGKETSAEIKAAISADGVHFGGSRLLWNNSNVENLSYLIGNTPAWTLSSRFNPAPSWSPFQKFTQEFHPETNRVVRRHAFRLKNGKSADHIQTITLQKDHSIEVALTFDPKGNADQIRESVNLFTFPIRFIAGKQIRIDGKTIQSPPRERWKSIVSGWISLGQFPKANRLEVCDPAGKVLFRLEFGSAPIQLHLARTGIVIQYTTKKIGSGLTFRLLPGQSSAPAGNASIVSGINFTADNDFTVPVFDPKGNFLINPSFESGPRYLYSRTADLLGQITDSDAHSGKYSLRMNMQMNTLCLPIHADRDYTVSFHVKLAPGKTRNWFNVTALSYNGKRKGYNGRATKEWKRHQFTFRLPTRCVILAFQSHDSVLIDDLQFEEGGSAGAYRGNRMGLQLLTSGPLETTVAHDGPVNARLRILGPAKTKGTIRLSGSDFFKRPLFNREVPFDLGEKGEQILPIADDSAFPLGVTVIRCDVKPHGLRAYTDFLRLNRFVFANNTAKHKNLLASWKFASMFPLLQNGNVPHTLLATLMRCGYGSHTYLHDALNPALLPLLKQYRMENFGAYITSFTQIAGKEIRLDGKKLHELRSYPDSLLKEAEELAFAQAKKHPWITYWTAVTEPGVHFATLREGNFREYAKLMLAINRGLMRANPKIAFNPMGAYNMGEGGRREILGVLQACRELEPETSFKAIDCHVYRAFPESPDLEEDLVQFLDGLSRIGYPKIPVLWGEGLYHYPLIAPEFLNLDPWVGVGVKDNYYRMGVPSYDLGWGERIAAANILRSYLVACKYADRMKAVCSWSPLFLDSRTPYSSMIMASVLTDLLGNSEFKEDIRFAPGARAYLFDDGKGRCVAALWYFDENLDRGLGNSAPRLSLSLPEGDPEFIDMMGNSCNVLPGGGTYEFTLTGFPIFIRMKKQYLPLLSDALKHADPKHSDRLPVEIAVRVKNTKSAELLLHNTLSREVRLGTALDAGKERLIVLKGRERKSMELPCPTDLSPDRFTSLLFPLEFTWGSLRRKLSFSISVLPVRYVREGFSWDSLPAIPLEHVIPQPDPQGKLQKWNGKTDLSGTMKIGWNEKNLHLRFEIRDDKFVMIHNSRNMEWWYKNDCIQLFFDTLGDAREHALKNRIGFDQNDMSYDIFPTSPRSAVAFRRHAPDIQLTGGVHNALLPNRAEPGVQCRFSAKEGILTYDLTFPARYLMPLRLEPGATPGLGIKVLDRDGEKAWNGLKQHLSNAPEELFGHPERFPQLLLLPER